MSPRVPLFDLGNVIVRLDWEPFLAWLAGKAGHGESARVKNILSSSLLFDFEFGSISRETFARRLGQLYHAEISVPEVEEMFCAIFPGLVEGMPELVEELLSEGPVYALSNTNIIHLEYIQRHYPVMNRFTKLFASHEMGKRKPYPGIYRDTAEELALPARSLVFFDDIPANVEGAIRAGLEAYVFSDAGQVRTIMKSSKETDDKEL